MMTSNNNTSAAKTVFGISELLDMILMQIRCRDMVHAAMTCRTWHEHITSSVDLSWVLKEVRSWRVVNFEEDEVVEDGLAYAKELRVECECPVMGCGCWVPG